MTTALRAGGLIVAGTGRREAVNMLLGGGSITSLALLAMTLTPAVDHDLQGQRTDARQPIEEDHGQ